MVILVTRLRKQFVGASVMVDDPTCDKCSHDKDDMTQKMSFGCKCDCHE